MATIDKISHHFGRIKPNQNLEAVFIIKNTGSLPLIIGTPRPSCSCVTTPIKESTGLLPGEEFRLPVSAHTSDAPSLRQHVYTSIRSEDGVAPRELSLELTGSQFEGMLISTRTLNYGTVVPGQRYDLNFRMQESLTDRFAIKSVATGDTSGRAQDRDHRGPSRPANLHRPLRARRGRDTRSV